jgi:hypothetical protein
LELVSWGGKPFLELQLFLFSEKIEIVFIKKKGTAPLVDIGKLWSSLHNFKLAKLLSIHKEEFPISSAFSIRPFTGINIRRRTTPLKYQTCVEGIKKTRTHTLSLSL